MRNPDLEFHDNATRKYQYGFDHIVRDYLLKRFADKLRTAETPLELGAYMGDMTAQLLEYYEKVDVIEGSALLADELRSRFGDEVSVEVSLFETAQPTHKYSDVFLIHTLEHLDDPVDSLARIATWLGPNGLLFVAVPNADALSRQIAVSMGLIASNNAVTEGEFDHGHRRTYSMDTLLNDVRQAGLQPLDFGGVIVKGLANYQFDLALEAGIVSPEYVRACDELARVYPHFSSSIFVVCSGPQSTANRAP